MSWADSYRHSLAGNEYSQSRSNWSDDSDESLSWTRLLARSEPWDFDRVMTRLITEYARMQLNSISLARKLFPVELLEPVALATYEATRSIHQETILAEAAQKRLGSNRLYSDS